MRITIPSWVIVSNNEMFFVLLEKHRQRQFIVLIPVFEEANTSTIKVNLIVLRLAGLVGHHTPKFRQRIAVFHR